MRAATAQIALQKLHDFRRTGIGICLQKANTAHDHSRGAVSALERARIEKRLLHGMQAAIFLKAFNRRNWLSDGRTLRYLARAARRAREQHGARAALPFPAPVLRPRQTAVIAEHGQKRLPWRAVHRISLAASFTFHCPRSS